MFLPAAPTRAQDGPDGDETRPPPEVIEDIGYAADIVPGSAEFEVLPAAAQALLIANPDVRAVVIEGRVAAFYGAPLATGATAAEAEQALWAAHPDAFGVSNLDLIVTRSHDVGFGRMTVFAYQQRIDGLPVEFGTARLVVARPERDGGLPNGQFAAVHTILPGFPLVYAILRNRGGRSLSHRTPPRLARCATRRLRRRPRFQRRRADQRLLLDV